MNTFTRRRFLQAAAATAVVTPLSARSAAAAGRRLHVACNQFCWINMYDRQGKKFNDDLDAGFAAVRRSGMDGLEMILDGQRPPNVSSRCLQNTAWRCVHFMQVQHSTTRP